MAESPSPDPLHEHGRRQLLLHAVEDRAPVRAAPVALQEIKRAANIYLEKGESKGFLEIERMRAKTLASEDAKEGMQSFIERRDPKFQGK